MNVLVSSVGPCSACARGPVKFEAGGLTSFLTGGLCTGGLYKCPGAGYSAVGG